MLTDLLLQDLSVYSEEPGVVEAAKGAEFDQVKAGGFRHHLMR